MQRANLKQTVDLVLTSPPYNISRSSGDKYNTKYDVYSDVLSDDEYINKTIEWFKGYDTILKPNGCVLYNISYSSENTQLIWLVIAEIIKQTNFTTADFITWHKKTAIPNNRSSNKLTRIVEPVFVFCRKSELNTFTTNKKVVSLCKNTNQANYENVKNVIFAKNNDGVNPYNNATFSTDLVTQLLNLYAKPKSVIYDSFMGVGTTKIASEKLGHVCYGSELSKQQIDYYLANSQTSKSDANIDLF